MKKVQKLGIMLLGLCFLAGCFFKPQITKEQQNNVATRIVRNYDVQEIEFVDFDKNQSSGSYELVLKLNNDEKITPLYSLSFRLDASTSSRKLYVDWNCVGL